MDDVLGFLVFVGVLVVLSYLLAVAMVPDVGSIEDDDDSDDQWYYQNRYYHDPEQPE